MPKWPWIERTFSFDFPASKWPDLLERLRGTPPRLEDRVRYLSEEVLTRRSEGGSWSIKRNIGHLIDLGHLWEVRIDQILAGERTLEGADMSNRKTNEADHDAGSITVLLARFREERTRLIERLEPLSDSDWSLSAIHPRLNQPMRIVDIAYFDAEHDDYHLGRIGELIRASTK